MSELPALELTPELIGCPRHLAPFREIWPMGFTDFTYELVSAYDRRDGVDPSQLAQVEALFREHPLCERVSRADLLAAYIHSEIGREDRCQVCRQEATGTAIKTRGPNGRVRHWRHVCFTCLVDRFGERLN